MGFSIPSLPGMPSLLKPPTTLSGLNKAVLNGALLTSDAFIIAGMISPPKWGIYLGTSLVVTADSVHSIEYKQDTTISNYPQEAGAFQSYNKVGTPFDVKLELTRGGTDADRALFMETLDSVAQTLKLYDVVTPEKIYRSANIQRIGYRRTASNGAGLITADVWLVQVRVNAAASFSNTASKSGADPVTVGTVNPTTPTQAITNFVGKVPPPAITNFVGLVPSPAPVITNFVGMIR